MCFEIVRTHFIVHTHYLKSPKNGQKPTLGPISSIFNFWSVMLSVIPTENTGFNIENTISTLLEASKHQIQSLDTWFEEFFNIPLIEKVSAIHFKYCLLIYRYKFDYNLICYVIYSEFIENCMFEWNVISKWLEIWQVVWYILCIHSNNYNFYM